MSNNIDLDKALYKKVIIKTNRRTFNLIMVINNNIDIFTFREDCLIYIKIIKNFKIKLQDNQLSTLNQ